MKNLIYFTILSMFVFGSFSSFGFQNDNPGLKANTLCDNEKGAKVVDGEAAAVEGTKKTKVKTETCPAGVTTC